MGVLPVIHDRIKKSRRWSLTDAGFFRGPPPPPVFSRQAICTRAAPSIFRGDSLLGKIEITKGDLLDQDVDAIVNAWNRNIIPWWLLLPQGVSGAIKRRGGHAPFRELAKHGAIPLGGAVLTSAGDLPFKAIIHVAGISLWWRSSEWSIRQSCRNALALAEEKQFNSIALPLIGAGTGGGSAETVLDMMKDELATVRFGGRIVIVKFQKDEWKRNGASRPVPPSQSA
ncbi:macro domain-containing protein [Rhodopirellula europaea]|uniref:macro domain-containing protein n=2 Tax=Rhodopirellula TaxID=265488 RepID=UPI0030EF781F